MIDAEIRDLIPRPAAAVRVSAPRSELAKLFDTHLPAIAERTAELGTQPAEPPYARYHEYSADRVDVEIGIPISRPLPNVPPLSEVPGGDLGNAELPGGPAAVTVHRGPYSGLAETYERLRDWIAREGRDEAGAPWESYVDDPSQVDEEELRTEVYWPVR